MRFNVKGLTIVLTALMGFSLASCASSNVSEHDHVWDNGEITKDPTCHSDGVKTYHCTVEGCAQTKTESVAMVAHNYDDGVITIQPTCSSTGEMTYTCVNEGCGKTRTVALEKIDHDYSISTITKVPDLLTEGERSLQCSMCDDQHTEALEAHADFVEQFDLEESAWSFASLESYSSSDTSISPVALTKENNIYKDNIIEISKGHIKTSGNALLSYEYQSDLEKIVVNTHVQFAGKDESTRLEAYLLLTDASNAIKNAVAVSLDSANWEFSSSDENAFELAEHDRVSLVIFGNGEGDLSLTLKAKCIHIWDEGIVTKEATTTENGIKTFHCIRCQETMERSIPMLEPTEPDPFEGCINFDGKVIGRFEESDGVVGNKWTTDDGYTLHVQVTTPGTAIWQGGTFVNTGIATEAGKAYNVSFEVSCLEEHAFEIVFQNQQWDEQKYATLYSPSGAVTQKINVKASNAGTLWLYVQTGNAVNEIIMSKLKVEETEPDPEIETNYFDFTGHIESRFQDCSGNIWVHEGDATKAHVKIVNPADEIWKGGMFINTGVAMVANKSYTVSMFLERMEETNFEVVLQNQQWDETKYLTIYSELGAVSKDIEVDESNEGSLWIYIQFGNFVNEITISQLQITEK